MWGSTVDDSKTMRGDNEPQPNLWHNPCDLITLTQNSADSSSDSGSNGKNGTWGESDAGNTSTTMAMQDYEALRRQLSREHRSRSRSRSRPGAGSRTTSSRRPGDEEAQIDNVEGKEKEDEDDFSLDEFMREGHFEKRKDGRSAKKVGVVYKDLTVKGVNSTATTVRTLPDALIGTFGPDLYRNLCRFLPFLRFGHVETRTLINSFSGVVRDGEMMLVLGRPGAGCSTFLKAIANKREGYTEVTGDVSYGGISAEKQKKNYRGEVNYNMEGM